MSQTPRIPLYYTFGNHMHWVDMQWLWGYEVLPGSVADMLKLCRETGAKGNVNFDAVGYEKMAAECPEALAELRDAVAKGIIEPVGCSYGQPYGLFHGGESNVRQLTYGVRTTRRLLGVRPRTFWEEEFYFFPQLPQMLAQCGYTGACLFFQWTWHTPEVPREPYSLIQWEGIDGTRLMTLPRNELNVHQWPEDFDGLLEKAKQRDSETVRQGKAGEVVQLPQAVVQWLELMPSKDWMCRSEVLLGRLKELMGDERFEVRARTMGEVIRELSDEAMKRCSDAGGKPESETAKQREGEIGGGVPVRRYGMDDVWHGMTLGKNADRHPRASELAENAALEAESLAALAGLFGRPYASWDVYPEWELDESWRQLLRAQHHDNHECEGLCGFIGHGQFDAARGLAAEVHGRSARLLSDRVDEPLAMNYLGFARDVLVSDGTPNDLRRAHIPPFGYASLSCSKPAGRDTVIRKEGNLVILKRGRLEAMVDIEAGVLIQVRSADHPSGVLAAGCPLGAIARTVAGASVAKLSVDRFDLDCDGVTIWFNPDPAIGDRVEYVRFGNKGISLTVRLCPDVEAVEISVYGLEMLARPDPGVGNAIRMPIVPNWDISAIIADGPFGADVVQGGGRVRRKYPRGDWMTSPQWFESLQGAITSRQFVDLGSADGSGLLVLHDGSQQMFRSDRGIEVVLSAYDPWDEARYDSGWHAAVTFRLCPHKGMQQSERVRHSLLFRAQDGNGSGVQYPDRYPPHAPVGGDRSENAAIPTTFGALDLLNASNVLSHAFFRESMKSGEHLPDWVGHRMFKESGGACTHPFVYRLVEWDGEPAEVVMKLPGLAAMVAKTNLMGEVKSDAATQRCSEAGAGQDKGGSGWSWADTKWLEVEHPVEPPEWAKGAMLKGKPITWSQVRFAMRPREIATIYADLVMGRKEWRDLDAKREVWATVHKK